MGFYGDQLLPRIQNRLMDLKQLRVIRARVCAGLAGDVIEIGFGSGLNLPHLPPGVTGVWAVDPADLGRRLSERRRDEVPVPVVFAAPDAEHLPFAADRFDAALSTWTLCTIPDPVQALRETRRVLKPGARLHFVEHGLAPDPGPVRWQHRLTPVQRRVAGGCHLDRDIPALLQAAGFDIVSLDTYYEKGAPRSYGFTYEGSATA